VGNFDGGGWIDSSTFSGNVSASRSSDANVGGLIGRLLSDIADSVITNSYMSGEVSAYGSNVGGLIGLIDTNTSQTVTISNSHASAGVSSTDGSKVGGLVGYADEDVTIQDSYATGSVSAVSQVGGLVGTANFSGSASVTYILRSFATGSVTASGNYVGGLVGLSYFTNIADTFATGAVNGAVGASRFVGGLVGDANFDTAMTRNFAAGVVTGLSERGALVGWSDNAIYAGNYFANDRGLVNAIGVNNSGGGVNPSGTLGAALSELQCPVAAGNTVCAAGKTLYNGWGDTVWDFGSGSQLPGLIINGTIYRDSNGDGVLD
jgi:hypothetical protein